MILEKKEINQIKTALKPEFEKMDKKFQTIDKRFETIDKRFEAIDRRFEAIDQRFKEIDQKFIDLREFMSRCFEDLKIFMHNTFVTKEEFYSRIEAIEDSLDEVRRKTGLVLSDGKAPPSKRLKSN